MYRVCFVCLGNICRSPTAEGVMRDLVARAGLSEQVEIDSAGTGAWHLGEEPDQRTVEAARRRGLELDHLAWQFTRADFDRFDLVLAVDVENLRVLERLASTPAARAKLRLLRSFDAKAPANAEVPDPYYGGFDGFDDVFEICLAACTGLLDHVRGQLAGRR